MGPMQLTTLHLRDLQFFFFLMRNFPKRLLCFANSSRLRAKRSLAVSLDNTKATGLGKPRGTIKAVETG